MHSQNDDSLAQQVEHLPFKQRVRGSSPRRITENLHMQTWRFFLCTGVAAGSASRRFESGGSGVRAPDESQGKPSQKTEGAFFMV